MSVSRGRRDIQGGHDGREFLMCDGPLKGGHYTGVELRPTTLADATGGFLQGQRAPR